MLFSDSADKAARFIWTCNAFNVPLLFLADVPGFMIGTQVERQGIIRHGAKMISAVSEATVPKISVVVRKAYGAGLYAMAGPAFEPDCCIALPSASIAVMGPQAAINAVYYNQLQAIEDEGERAAETEQLRAEYAADIDILHLASELVIDAVIEPELLREELIRRFAQAGVEEPRLAREAQPRHARLAGARSRDRSEPRRAGLHHPGRAGRSRSAGRGRRRCGPCRSWPGASGRSSPRGILPVMTIDEPGSDRADLQQEAHDVAQDEQAGSAMRPRKKVFRRLYCSSGPAKFIRTGYCGSSGRRRTGRDRRAGPRRR